MGIPAVIVRVDGTGAVVAVEIPGRSEPPELVETQKSEPMAHFGDDEYKARIPPWAAGG